jgi:hypothetical protein
MVHPYHTSIEDYFTDLLEDYPLEEIIEMAGCSEVDALVTLFKSGMLELPDALDPSWKGMGTGEG